MGPDHDEKFERSLSLPYVVSIAIGGMLGSGLFVLPGLAASKTGPSVWLAYLLAAICVIPAALSKAEMATAMPTSGGTYIYIERAFGPLFGTISGLGLRLSLLLKSSFALIGFGAYLLILVEVNMKVAALVSLVLIMILNISGVKKVGKVQLIVLTATLLGLAFLIGVGLLSWDVNLMRPSLTHGSWGLMNTTALVFVSYAGVTKVAAIAGEIKNPSRNLPIAMIVALAAVTFVYVLVTFIMVGNVPVENLQNDIHPIYTFALTVGGKSLGIAASVLGVFTLISMANSGVLAASRFPFAMSRDELLPKVLGRIHPKFLTPTLTIFVTCLVMALAIIFLDVEKIAKLASAFMVTMFILVNACVIVLRETSVHWYQPSYRAPLYPYLQIFGIVSGVILLFFLGFTPMLAVLAIFLLGYLSFEFYGKSRAQRKGVLRMYGHRPALAFLYNRRAKTEMGNTVQTVSSLGKKSQKSVGKLIDKEANVVVALFGKEYSPEMVVETGLALAGANQMQVVHVTEVPEQTALEAVDDVTLIVKSIERRVQAMAEDKKAHFKFDSVATHEIIDTMHTISDLTHCEWMVMGWEGRASRGLLVRNPTGWLTTHLNSHFALFKDNGVRYIRKILVCLRPGRDEVLFLNVADRLAQYHRASFTLIRVLKENASDKECQDLMASSQQMLIKSKSSCDVKIIRDNQTVEAIVKTASSYDLLITGTPANENIVRSLFGSGRDKFAETASCSVLRLTVKRT